MTIIWLIKKNEISFALCSSELNTRLAQICIIFFSTMYLLMVGSTRTKHCSAFAETPAL